MVATPGMRGMIELSAIRKVLHAVDAQMGVDHGLRVLAQAAGADLMEVGRGTVAHEVVHRLAGQLLAWRRLALDELLHRGRVADLAAHLDAKGQRLDFVRVREEACIDDGAIRRVGRAQPDLAAALRRDETGAQGQLVGGGENSLAMTSLA